MNKWTNRWILAGVLTTLALPLGGCVKEEKSLGEEIKDVGDEIGDEIEDAADEIEDAVEDIG